MDLLAGLLGLALFAIVVRCAVLPNFIRCCSLSSGVVLYVSLHLLASRCVGTGSTFGNIWGDSRFGLILGASILFGLLVRLAVLPFSGNVAPRFAEARACRFPTPATHVAVWIAGSVLVRVLFIRPSVLTGPSLHVTRADLPLLLFCSMVLLAFVLWKLMEEYGGQQRAAAGEGVSEVPRSDPMGKGERDLQKKIRKLQQEAGDAERRWAAAVLQERAARILAERLAREFAEARSQTVPVQEAPRPLTVEQAFAIFDLAPGCDGERLKEAYRRLILQNHPDKVAALSPALREVAERETKSINAAYALALRHTLTASPTVRTNRTPSRATGDCPRASRPSDSHPENRGTLKARPAAAGR